MNKEKIFERKTDDEIRTEIISACWTPMGRSIESIRKRINSNWSTTKKYANELADSGVLERIEVENQTVGFKVNHLFKMSVANAYSDKCSWIDLEGEIPKEYPIKDSSVETEEIEG